MRNNLHYTAAALRDLDEIWNYIGEDLNSPATATRIVNNIMNDIDLLEEYDEMGVELFAVTGVESEYRYIVSGKYIVFYRPIDNEIYIDRILHSRRDFMQILFD